jgi:hypothetical protein
MVRFREANRTSVEKIVVGADGSLTLLVRPEGLLGTLTAIAEAGRQGTGPMLERTIQSGTGKQWRVIGTG